MKPKGYQICEFESFFIEGAVREVPGYHALPSSIFSQLENFLLEHSSARLNADFWMTLSIRRGFGKIITVHNYVGVILHADSDFALCSPGRTAHVYQNLLLWSHVFLEGKSFTSYSGSHLALALLFPMEKVFESYVAALLRKHLNGKPYFLSVQDTTHYLFDGPKKTFQLRPDLVILRKADGAVFIADAS